MANVVSNRKKDAASVFAAGLTGMAVAPGVVYTAEKLLPSQMKGLKNFLARNVIEPHLEFFGRLSKGLDEAHERYDDRQEKLQLARGEKVQPRPPESRQQRAYNIADSITRTGLALGSDFVITAAMQALCNRVFKLNVHPTKTAFWESTLQLGGIALMPTLFAVPSENIHHGLSKMLNKVLGMSKKSADDIALPFTYVTLPGLAATGLMMAYAPHSNGR